MDTRCDNHPGLRESSSLSLRCEACRVNACKPAPQLGFGFYSPFELRPGLAFFCLRSKVYFFMARKGNLALMLTSPLNAKMFLNFTFSIFSLSSFFSLVFFLNFFLIFFSSFLRFFYSYIFILQIFIFFLFMDIYRSSKILNSILLIVFINLFVL